MPIHRALIANRGEIAVRVIRAAQALGIETVQAVSAADRDSQAAQMADQTVVIGPALSKQSYLDARLIVHAAKATACDALHPGYGFLAERAELARLCSDNGIIFVGPRADTIEALGDKLSARAVADRAGVPLIPGSDGIAGASEACTQATMLGYPVMMKAAAGGGGRGMFIARDAAEIEASFDKASTEALEAFGDGTLYMERYVENARHVEVQVVGDGAGGVLHFGERDCSVQRRYQKVVEEAPCAAMPGTLRGELHAAAVNLLASLNYLNAGTVEFSLRCRSRCVLLHGGQHADPGRASGQRAGHGRRIWCRHSFRSPAANRRWASRARSRSMVTPSRCASTPRIRHADSCLAQDASRVGDHRRAPAFASTAIATTVTSCRRSTIR